MSVQNITREKKLRTLKINVPTGQNVVKKNLIMKNQKVFRNYSRWFYLKI